MSQPDAYNAKTVYWLLGVGLAAFAAAAWFVIYSEGDQGMNRANAYSYSAIGHRALVDSLREVGIPVLVSRSDSAAKAGENSLLVLAEPRVRNWYERTIDAEPGADEILLVLPKWDGLDGHTKPHWLWVAGMIPGRYVEAVLREVLPDGSLVRLPGPVKWNTGVLGVEPDIEYPQLIESRLLKPTVWSDQGVLAGWVRYGSQRIWILSDPDILSNHGLGSGDNAVLTMRLLDAVRPPAGPIVFDETIHGYWRPPNLWRSMFELPYVVPVILAAVAAMMLGWAAMRRFGAPLPPRPPFASGKAVLIDNTASLLRFGGHGSEILVRYAETTLRGVAHRLNAPRHLDDAALVEWVDRVGRARGVSRDYSEIRNRLYTIRGKGDTLRLARAARRLYQWKREMIDGS